MPAIIVAWVGALWFGSAVWLSRTSVSSAWGQSNPGRVVIVVPFAAGAPDSVARVMAKQLQAQLGQSIIVENRPAANGTIATEAVARAAPDGATLLMPSIPASIASFPMMC
jgi:tripartite-type tricarboxylate transporter receptor subunit TctC